ncbi:MAG: hypothetical protein J6Y43_06100, partial [Clostridia bacterium]|nr:hypothetical protein [Clostridia bacterium]
MASIYGFTVKGVKYFQGRDWEGCQGDIYYNGKKVGFYNDLGDGAPATIDLCAGDGERDRINGLLQDAVDKYYKRFPLEEEYARLEPDAEMFIAKLIGLTEDEKEYKKFRKQIFEKTGNHPAVIAFYTRHKPFGSFMQ